MLNEKRLTQIETSLTPKQALRLWLRQEFQGKTTQEYDRWLIAQPVTAFPRIRVERQVMGAIQAAMKGQDPFRIQQAVRQAHMETDFLMLLVFRANSVVRNQSHSVWLQILSAVTMLFSGVLRDEQASYDLEVALQEATAELFSLPLAVERIQTRYFDGECILAKDVRENLDWPIMFLRCFFAGVDQKLEEAGHPERVIDSEEFRNVVDHKAEKKATYFPALAKSEMLWDFGCGEAGKALMRPYVLGDQ
jgi:hypothetical protein